MFILIAVLFPIIPRLQFIILPSQLQLDAGVTPVQLNPYGKVSLTVTFVIFSVALSLVIFMVKITLSPG